MASACSHFRPNLWRPTTCANCFFPKARHAIPEAELAEMGDTQDEDPYAQPMPQLLPEAEGRQVGVVKPYAIFKIPEELQRKNSESSLLQNSVVSPPRSRLATVSLSEEPRLVQHSMIGPPRSRLATVSLSEEPRLVQHSMIGPPRSRLATVSLSEAPVHHRQQSGGTELLERRGRSASVTTPLRLSKQPIIPKRKAPPPPSRPPAKPRHSLKPKGCTKTTTQLPSPHPVHKNSTVAQQVPGHRARARTVVGNETTATLRKKKIPPQKPPRTLSTFITSAEQEALLQQLLAPQQPSGTKQQLLAHQQPPGTKHQLLAPQQPPGTKQQPSQHRRSYSEYAHLSEPQHQQHGRRSRLSLPQLPYHFSSEPAVIQQCIAVAYHSQNSAGHPGSEFTASAGHSGSSSRSSDSSPPPPSVFVSPGQLHSEISLLMMATLHAVSEGGTWGKVCREQLWECQWQDFQILSPNLVSHNGIPLSLESAAPVLEEGARELAMSRLLEPHPNVSLVRALLATPPSLRPIPAFPRYLLRDCIDGGPLCEVLRKQRQVLPSHEYTELVLLCLVQVFTGLLHLYQSGTCHRDLGLDCIHTTSCGSHHLLRITNLCYALHRPGPITATTFVYGYHELKWLGGADSRLPPEIMNTPENAQTLDYGHTDCFAAGCLLYEMMGQENPFEQDADLVYRQYSEQDLPPVLPGPTPNPSHLQQLAELLLHRLPACRLATGTALLLTQALLWLPQQWISEPISEAQVRHHLDYERAQLVAALARDGSASPPLPLLLKARFLASCDVLELIRALSLFNHL